MPIVRQNFPIKMLRRMMLTLIEFRPTYLLLFALPREIGSKKVIPGWILAFKLVFQMPDMLIQCRDYSVITAATILVKFASCYDNVVLSCIHSNTFILPILPSSPRKYTVVENSFTNERELGLFLFFCYNFISLMGTKSGIPFCNRQWIQEFINSQTGSNIKSTFGQ